MQAFFDWLDARLGYRGPLQTMRRRVLPDGPSWWYTSASCLFWLLIIECVTGLLLMATYSPSMASAWASVHFIDQTAAGRFLRGIHHYASHALIVLFSLHVLRVLVMGAYRAPRELIWITGLLMFPLVLVWTVTGNPLSASQKGIAQIQVEGNILGATPVVGPMLQRLLFGGDEVGNLTLTRLYFLHVGLLPLLVGSLCFLHLHQVIKHSPYRPANGGENTSSLLPYWPYQTIRNMITLAVVVGVIAVISWRHGAPLAAPADPDLVHSPRPEWYFRWLFELRRHFTGDTEFIATLVVPALFLGVFLAAPFLDRLVPGRLGAACRIVLVAGCLGGWSWLTYLSYHRDATDAEFLASTADFEALSARARQLALTEPITGLGAVELLRNDPQTQGPRLFALHCSGCHAHVDRDGRGIAAAEPSAPNLYGFGRPEWIAGFLDPVRIADDDHFGKTAFREGDMAQHLKGLFEEAGEEGAAELRVKLEAATRALAAEAGYEPPDSASAVHGRALLTGELGCVDCHKFHDRGELGSAPDLTGYASAAWLAALITSPKTERFYGDRNDRMPSFAEDAAHPELNLLSQRELDLLVRWLAPSVSQPAANRPLVNRRNGSHEITPPAQTAATTAP
jgi:ubiquinol-cytochrome c reductase cytochrome b subunit